MTQNPAPSSAPTKPRRKLLRRVLLFGGPVALVVVGLYFYLHGGRIVTSDNAYVHAAKLTISSEVAGSVVEVSVRDNEPVTVGRVLCRIDDSAYRLAVDQAQAQLGTARSQLATLRASHRQKLAQIDEATEQADFAERELKRQETLSSVHVGTEAELDKARHALEAARRRADVLRQDAATVLASLGGDPNKPDEKYAIVAEARAKLATAERDLARTVVRAPIAGVVTNVSNIEVGRYLTPGQPAFTLVAVDHLWVEANLKETELTYVKVGDPVTVAIDTYPQHEWRAKVATIGPATGAEFALIPAQNASGNWVKVVQRIPVRLEVETIDPARPLRSGMSAEVKIDTGHARRLGDLVHTARTD